MKYCSYCSAELVFEIPEDDNRHRFICRSCETVHYQNPKIVTGTIPVWENKILLCKRAIEPRYGFWTLPAGFMEIGETTQEAAIRETLEEANARVELEQLYTVINLPYANQVYFMYRSRLLDIDFSPGEESLEVMLYEEKDIPWDEIAFMTVKETLRYFFKDRIDSNFCQHTGDVIKEEGVYKYVETSV